MVGLFERLFGKFGQSKTSKIAKDRLQFVLVQDRINLPSEQMRQMKQEIIEVISKYVTVDMENVDFELSNRDRSGLLIAEIPFKAAKSPDDLPDSAEGDLRISVQADDVDVEEKEPEATPEDTTTDAEASQPVQADDADVEETEITAEDTTADADLTEPTQADEADAAETEDPVEDAEDEIDDDVTEKRREN